MVIYCRNKKLRFLINWISSKLTNREILFPSIPKDNKILFFKRDRNNFEFLSNFYYTEFLLDNQIWSSVEQYYQCQKSENSAYKNAIMNSNSNWQLKQISDSRIGNKWQSKNSWFIQNPQDLREDWDSVKFGLMHKAIEAKLEQNEDLKRKLIATKNAELIEDSKWDFYWGVGHDKSGENRLGKLLMKLRDELMNKGKL